jgi:hypothetical protein
MDRAHIVVAALGQLLDGLVDQDSKSAQEQQCEIGARA